MDHTLRQVRIRLDDNEGSGGESPVRSFDQNHPAGCQSTRRLSPHIQEVLDRGLRENLSRIVLSYSVLSNSGQPFQFCDSGCKIAADHCRSSPGRDEICVDKTGCENAPIFRASSLFLADSGVSHETNKTVTDTDLSVAETIAGLQELVFEWEDLYFQESDAVPEETIPHLYVWALRGRRPVPVSPKSIVFGFGQVYIILHVKSFVPSPIMTCFYWVGHKAHFSSVACAAIHVIQLSRRIGCMKTSRQMEGSETVDFFDALGSISVVPSSSEPSLQVTPIVIVYSPMHKL
jgi:hypothetical protein